MIYPLRQLLPADKLWVAPLHVLAAFRAFLWAYKALGARTLAAVVGVVVALSPLFVRGPIPGCTAIAVWSQSKTVTILSCVTDVPEAPDLVVALNLYGAVFPFALAVLVFGVLVARNWRQARWVGAATVPTIFLAYQASWVDGEGIVQFINMEFGWLLVTAMTYILVLVLQIGAGNVKMISQSDLLKFILAVRLGRRYKGLVPQLGDLLIALAYVYVAGVLGTLFADLARMPEQISAGTKFVHVGGADFADAVFKAGWFASLIFSVALMLAAVLWAGRFAKSGKTRKNIPT